MQISDPQCLGYKFLAEARRLWELEASKAPNITTLQAGIVLGILYNCNALDKLGVTYFVHAISLAHQLGIFSKMMSSDPDVRIVSEYTAWGLFGWQL